MYNVDREYRKDTAQARKAVQALAWGVNSVLPKFITMPFTPGRVDSRKGGKVELVEMVKDLVCNVGFPIFMVVILIKEMDAEREAHKAESEKWVTAFNNNTEALNGVKSIMERIMDKIGGAV